MGVGDGDADGPRRPRCDPCITSRWEQVDIKRDRASIYDMLDHMHVGLLLTEDIQFCVSFFAPQGEKMTHKKDKIPCCRRLTHCERKSYAWLGCIRSSMHIACVCVRKRAQAINRR
jgi:hypothetical protein